MQLHLGFTALAGLAVFAIASATPTAQAQCSNGGYYGSGYGGGYYAPTYAPQQNCAPPVYYSQPTYRSYSVNVGIGHGHHDGRYSVRHDWRDRHDRHDRHHDRGHRSQRRHHR